MYRDRALNPIGSPPVPPAEKKAHFRNKFFLELENLSLGPKAQPSFSGPFRDILPKFRATPEQIGQFFNVDLKGRSSMLDEEHHLVPRAETRRPVRFNREFYGRKEKKASQSVKPPRLMTDFLVKKKKGVDEKRIEGKGSFFFASSSQAPRPSRSLLDWSNRPAV